VNPEHDLAHAISQLACAVRESTEARKQDHATSQQLADVYHKLTQVLASKTDLENVKDKIMSAISTYSEAVNAKFDEIATSVDELGASLTGIAADVAGLKDIILQLQNNPGPISAEDQALLDAGVTKVTSLATRTAAAAAAAKELDAATENPPATP